MNKTLTFELYFDWIAMGYFPETADEASSNIMSLIHQILHTDGTSLVISRTPFVAEESYSRTTVTVTGFIDEISKLESTVRDNMYGTGWYVNNIR